MKECTVRPSCFTSTHSWCRGDFSRRCLAKSCAKVGEEVSTRAMSIVRMRRIGTSLVERGLKLESAPIKLQLRERPVDTIISVNQFGVRSRFHGLALLDDKDPIRAAYGRQAMSNDDRGAVFHEPFERLLDQA